MLCMEIKKTMAADLESGRATWFLLGLILVLAVFFVVFEYTDKAPVAEETDDDILDELPEHDDGLVPMMLPHTALRLIDVPERHSEAPLKTRLVDDKPAVEEEIMEEILDAIKADRISVPALTEQEAAAADEGAQAALMDDKPLDFRVVESLPQFPGGAVEFMKWLTRNLRYPLAAERQKIEGRVVVQFVVERDGSISGLQVVKKAHPYLDREAMRVLRTMPKWTAGVQNDRPCRTMVCIPVVFKL